MRAKGQDMNARNFLNHSLPRSLAVVAMLLFGAVLAPVHAAETITYYHLDALGSPVVATDEQGNLKWREDYKPYGEKIRNEPASSSNSRAYTGHPHDNDTGLTYAGARYYDPVVGRFMAVDPVDFTEKNLHSFNRYAYVENNPFRYTDPYGLWSVTVGGYLGWGFQVSFGQDDNTGGGFITGRPGYGIGGGFEWSRYGTRPGSEPSENTGGFGVGGFGDIQFNFGPLQASLESNAGINYNNDRDGASPYSQLFQPTWSLGDSWGIKAEIAIGIEGTLYSPKNPSAAGTR